MIDADLLRSGAHRNMIEHLAGPLRAGALDELLTVDAAGTLDVSWTTREAVVLVAPAFDLLGSTMTVSVTRTSGAAGFDNATLTFADYTEREAYLPAYRPDVDATLRTAGPFALTLGITITDASGIASVVAATDVASKIVVRMVQGVTGRVIALLAAEKARIRREYGVVAACRTIDGARANALDRLGAELGVRRFDDALTYDASTKSIAVTHIDAGGNVISESDPAYRKRLKIYRPQLRANRVDVLSLLGLDGVAGFGLRESSDEFAITVATVESGTPGKRQHFLDYVRAAYLVWLERSPAADAIHAARFIEAGAAAQSLALRTRLSTELSVPAEAAIAPGLATALDVLTRTYAALGLTLPLHVTRAQDGTAGSRYELGLGVDVIVAAATDYAKAASALQNAAFVMPADTEIAGVLDAARATISATGADAAGAWLFNACGLRTVHEINPTTLYLSHLFVSGLVIEGPSTVPAGAGTSYTARYEAPGDPTLNAALFNSLATASAAWTAAGHTAWTRVADAQIAATLATVASHAAADPIAITLTGAGLLNVTNAATSVTRLEALPPELWTILKLDASDATPILAAGPAAIDRLTQLVATLRAGGVVSVLPFTTTDGSLLLAAGAIGLPDAGLNLSEQRSSGFRWYTVAVQGPAANIGAIGSRTTFVPGGDGLYAIVCIGYAAAGATKPYEVGVTLPDATLLDLEAYEFTMNVLAYAHPIGVTYNTYELRNKHIDLTGDGTAGPMPPTLARTYRSYREQRYRSDTVLQ